MDSKIFCPNCGQSINRDMEFCPNCGFNLTQFFQQTNSNVPPIEPVNEPVTPVVTPIQPSEPTTRPTRSNQSAKQNKPNNGKKKKLVITLIALLAILGGLFFTLNSHFSKENQLDELSKQINSPSKDNILKAFVKDSGDSLTDHEADNISKYLSKNTKAANKLAELVKSGSHGDNFDIDSNGKNLLIFPKYKVAIKEASVKIITNADDPEFLIDNEKVTAKESDDEYRLTGLYPGTYEVTLKANKQTKKQKITVPFNSAETDYIIDIKKKRKAKKEIETKPIDVTKRRVRSHQNEDDQVNNQDDEDTNQTDDQSDDETDTNESTEPEDDTSSNSSTSTGLIGTWTNDDDTVVFNSDGTYRLNEKSGTYKINSHSGDKYTITYMQDNNAYSSWTANYTLVGNVLTLLENNTTWTKQ